MEENYRKTGRYTADGETFHYARTNVRIGDKHYGNASEELLKSLGLFENVIVMVQSSDYTAAMEQWDEEDPDFPYRPRWQEIDGEKYWVSFEIVPDVEPEQNE